MNTSATKKTLLTKRYRLSLTHSIPADFVSVDKTGVHGHDMLLEITINVGGEAHEPMSCNISNLDQIVNETVITPLDGNHLNDTVEPATGEKLGEFIHNRLLQTAIGSKLQRILVVETRKNRFIIEKS